MQPRGRRRYHHQGNVFSFTRLLEGTAASSNLLGMMAAAGGAGATDGGTTSGSGAITQQALQQHIRTFTMSDADVGLVFDLNTSLIGQRLMQAQCPWLLVP
jgi:hypothetical protein